jgi:HK97 family phage portal protein
MANIIQRFRSSWGLMREIEQFGKKSAAFPYAPSWQKATYRPITFENARDDGYNANAAVSACVRALTFAFPEPDPILVDQTNERISNHPLQRLLDRPNPFMSHKELLIFAITYIAIGGNCYLHKVRNKAGQVIELWPYHDGHFSPVPGNGWIKNYVYNIGEGREIEIPAEDVVHLKWPMPDLSQPWIALPPLRSVAKEVNTDSELTRMLHEILLNNVPIRTVINVPAGTSMSPDEADAFLARFMMRHRGGQPALVEGANSITHMNLNLAELDLTSLRGVPESRICSAYGVPPEVAMLSIGQAHSTENNLYAADVRFSTRTLTPLWAITAGELTQDLAPEFGGNVRVLYDVASIQALKKDEVATWTRVIAGYDANLITKNEGRAEMGLVPVGQLKITDPGDTFKSESLPEPPPMQPNIIDVTASPPQLEDDEKSLVLEIKAKQNQRILSIQQRMEAAAQAKIESDIEAAAASL